jgi:hypothetical protein
MTRCASTMLLYPAGPASSSVSAHSLASTEFTLVGPSPFTRLVLSDKIKLVIL